MQHNKRQRIPRASGTPAASVLANGISRHAFNDAGVTQPPTRDAIGDAFTAARETVAKLEAERDARKLVAVGGLWSPAHHARAAS